MIKIEFSVNKNGEILTSGEREVSSVDKFIDFVYDVFGNDIYINILVVKTVF